MLYFRSPAVDRDLDPSLTSAQLGDGGLSTFSETGMAPSAVIDTQRGAIQARELVPGDRVITRDGGFSNVRWVGESMTVYDASQDEAEMATDGPVRIRAGALGTDPEGGNLVVNSGHRILIKSEMNELYFGTDEVIAQVGDLTHLDGVDFVTRSVMRYKHVLLDTHELIRVNGAWMESFAPRMWAIRVAFPQQWEEITDAVPRLRYENGESYYIAPRLTLDAREASLIELY